MSDHVLIRCDNLRLRRGGRELYAGLDLSLSAGERLWLRGSNGRGKSSLIRVLAGLLTPDAGKLLWREQEFSSRIDEDRQAISLLDERLGLSRELSVLDNLRYAAGLQGRSDFRRPIDRLNLDSLLSRRVQQLSTGQKKRVALARILLEDSQVWLLDEPGNGLDHANRQLLTTIIEEHCSRGGACLFASHDVLPFSQSPRELDLEQCKV